MATATCTLTGDLSTLVATTPLQRRLVHVWLESNAGDHPIVDTSAGGRLHLGAIPLTLDAAGAFTQPGIIRTDSTDINIVDNTLRYRVRWSYADPAAGRQVVGSSGWFPLTGDADLKDVANVDELAIPIWYSGTIAELEGYVEQTAQYRDETRDISNIDTSDEAVEALLKGTAGTGAKSRAALDQANAALLDQPGSAFRAKQLASTAAMLGAQKLDRWTGTAETADDSSTLQAAFTAAASFGFALLATAGKTYRGHGLDPIGTLVDWRGATLKVPDGVTALNMFQPTGVFRTIGGEFDGNRDKTTDGGSDTTSCGVYMHNAAGWAGQIRMEGGPVFHDFHRHGARFATATSTSGTVLSDAANAPAAAVFLDSPEVYNCKIGLYALGLTGYETRNPYTHNNRADGNWLAICRESRQTGVRSHGNGGHGHVSLYCLDDYTDGVANDNYNGGFTWGGGSAVVAPGRNHQAGSLIARRNGLTTTFGGVVFDPRVTGTDAALVEVNAQLGQIIATGNGGAGVQVSSAQYVHVGVIISDNNVGAGVGLATRNFSYGLARCRNNGTRGIAQNGNSTRPNYGAHRHGHFQLSGNGDGLSVPWTEDPSYVAPSAFTVVQQGTNIPSAVPTQNIGPADHGLLAWSFDPVAPTTQTVLVSGTAQVVTIPVRTAMTITNLLLYVGTAGASLVSGQSFAALYQGGVLLGVTADQSSAWTSTGVKTMAIVGGPVNVAAGTIQVVFWSVGTTPPAFARTSNFTVLANVNLATSVSRFGTADTGLTTTAPSTLGTITAKQVPFWAALS